MCSPADKVASYVRIDAIALTRGDRFYTHDFTPAVYTSWGFKDCQRNPGNPGAGSVLGPLLLRTLPHHYPSDSVWTWFSMITPDVMRQNLTRLGKEKNYTFHRPVETPVTMPMDTVPAILEHSGRGGRGLRSAYGTKAREIIEGGG